MTWSIRPSLPTELQLEVTGACNLRCKMCLVSYRPPMNRAKGSMSFDMFKRLVDDLPQLEKITLQGLGEPLLAPDLLRMVEYAAARDIRMGFNTNATLLTRAIAERLIQAGLCWLHVSLDGATPATYEGIRDRSHFERVYRNVAALVAAKQALGKDNPNLSIVMVAMRRNIGELVDLVRLTHDLGVDRMWVQNLSHSFSDTDPVGSYEQIRVFTIEEALWPEPTEQVVEIFRQATAVAEDLGVHLRLPRLEPAEPAGRACGTAGCNWPWRSTFVNHDGTVQPCCMVMGSDRMVLGDVRTASFAQVWHSPEYVRFREGLLSDDPPAVCRGCSLYRRVF